MAPLRSVLVALILLLASARAVAAPFVLAYGSCLRQWGSQPVWDGILAVQPRAFVFGGDNVYTDAGIYRLQPEPARIGTAYAELARVAGFDRLRAAVPVYATWDDHDYGRNDAGAEYPHKQASKRYFMDFFGIAADAPMRSRAGIYAEHWFEHEGRRIQLLLLDTRSFRSALLMAPTDAACPRKRHARNEAPAATVLGAAQWDWLAARVHEPADLRVVVSSIQVIPDAHCWEKWANFPRERTRLLDLLAHASRVPVLLLSGDRHLAEISRIDVAGARHPLVELTSSGMNSAGAGAGERNRYRALPDNVRTDNFATVAMAWSAGGVQVDLAIRGVDGSVLQRLRVAYPSP